MTYVHPYAVRHYANHFPERHDVPLHRVTRHARHR
jgi:hypothetical protein